MGAVCGKSPQIANHVNPAFIQKKESRSEARTAVTPEKASSRTVDPGEAPRVDNSRKNNIKKRGAVIDARAEVTAGAEARTAQVTEKPKTHWEVQMITMAVHRHSVLTDLTEDAREEVINSMKFFMLNPNEVVFQQGGLATHFFVAGSGSLEVLVNNVRVNVMKTGDSFGELALLHNTPRSATVRTLERTTLWGVDRKTFREAVEQVNIKNYRENRDFLNSVPLFNVMTSEQKENLLAVVTTQRFLSGKKIVIEGEPGDLFYLIKEGTVSCSLLGVEVRKMQKGDYFGEQALLYNTTRTATVTAFDNVRVLSIGREQLREVLGTSLQRIIYRNTQRIALDKSEALSKLTGEQKEKLIDHIDINSFQDGDEVIPADSPLNEALRIVLKGTLRTSTGQFADTFAVIGEKQIMQCSDERTKESVIAGGFTDIATITKAEFEAMLGGDITQVATRNEALAVLKTVSLFRGFSTEKLFQLLSALRVEAYTDNQDVVRQGDVGDAFFIVKSGNVQVVKDGNVLRTIAKNDFFGERSVLSNEVRTASVVSKGVSECWVLHQKDFLSIVDESVTRQLMKRIQLQDDTVSLGDLSMVKVLGRGMFGSVYLVVHRAKQTLYALKTVPRVKVRRYEIAENLILERQLLLQIDHSFIMKLVKTFKDERRVYFLTEFVNGQDLFDVIRVLGLLKESESKFYTACLLLILEHLHDRCIIYRDLKPENVMVDEMGYLKLIDFGTAKLIAGRTFTIVGTPHYMAPEVVLGKGYGLTADVWSLGIMLYEFVCGAVPFGEEDEDPFLIYEKILHESLRYPASLAKGNQTRQFIDILLSKNPALRCVGGISKLKEQKWFFQFDWEKLGLKQIAPPLVPKTKELTEEVERGLSRRSTLQSSLADEEATEQQAQGEEHPEPEGWDKDF